MAAAKFIAHLVNQQVALEIIALELASLLLEKPSEGSVEVAVGFVKESGAVLRNLSPKGLHGIFERCREILYNGEMDKRLQFIIGGVFAAWKVNFEGPYQGVLPELDLVEEHDQITYDLSLDDELDDQSCLDVFRVDPDFLENEKKYEVIKKKILGDEWDKAGAEEEEEEEGVEEEDEHEMEQRIQIGDESGTNLVELRRTIYLTIASSVNFEEAGHKYLKSSLSQDRRWNLCYAVGMLQSRAHISEILWTADEPNVSRKTLSTVSCSDILKYIDWKRTRQLRNVAKFFCSPADHRRASLAFFGLHQTYRGAYHVVLTYLHQDSFQELSEHLGLPKLNERLTDPGKQDFLDGIYPKDSPKNSRFAINFFTCIGLEGLTGSMRKYLQNMRPIGSDTS